MQCNTIAMKAALVIILSTLALSACGGGGGTTSGLTPSIPDSGSSGDTNSDKPVPIVVGGVITDVSVSSSAASTDLPLTFGQTFVEGTVFPSDAFAGKLSDGSVIPMQADVKATNADGSVRHAIMSTVLPSLAANQSQTVQLTKAAGGTGTGGSGPSALLDGGFTASVNLNLNGQVYTASADALLRSGSYTTWLAGPIANEWIVSAPLKTATGVAHPHLTARFAIRAYTGLAKAKVDVVIENDWAFEPAPQNFTYDAQVIVAGQTVYSKAALKHFHHARWRKSFWWGAQPAIYVKHNSSYLIASKAVPNYDQSIAISGAGLSSLNSRWAASNTAPMGTGILTAYMPTTGARPDIAPLPQWAALYLLSMDSRAKAVTLGVGDLAGSWPIHYRDKVTDRPISIVDYPYIGLLGYAGDKTDSTGKVWEFPACVSDCASPYEPDSAHQPSVAYVPYLVTGDYYYLEELQFWANFNVVQAHPGYRHYEKGIVEWDQVRGQAWTLRTLGQAAYITPDSHPMKSYFVDRVENNLAYYNEIYTKGAPNQLGIIDGSGPYTLDFFVYTTASGAHTGFAAWQDDFFTWSVGYLSELGFSNARPLLAWKARFPVGRMTTPGYCWVDASVYALAGRSTSTGPLLPSLAQMYAATFKNDQMIDDNQNPIMHPAGLKYLDQPCGSQAQADWRTAATGTAWAKGQMVGYATTPDGVPAILQSALAVSVKSGIPNARTAWDIFNARGAKPDYSEEPQWALVPRD